MRLSTPVLLLSTLLAAGGSCSSGLTQSDLETLIASAAETQIVKAEWHRGPSVTAELTGPARFTEKLLAGFQTERALEVLTHADGYYRAPGNEGYEAVLERVAAELRGAGFGQDERLALRFFEQPRDHPAWTPRSASIVLESGGKKVTLHSFEKAGDVDRCILPINAPACEASGPIVMSLDELEEGDVLVTEAPLVQVLQRATSRGAAGVVSASIEPFNVDPTGKNRHLEAIQFRSVQPGTEMPVFQISQKSYLKIAEAVGRGRAELRLSAAVEWSEGPLRTLSATILGAEHPEKSVVIVSHVQEPGACDNASGVAGLCESARSLAEALRAGTLPWPAHSVDFAWGDEFVQSETWLAQSGRTAIAGLSSDMTGESYERTGAIALLERMPDPGALRPLAPDEHTPWGAGEVTAEDLLPNGLAVIARCAMIDVGRHSGGWHSADHPWEGGSDHDVFAEHGIPAVLFWHFTDFSYHTSLDRIGMVDGDEIRRTAAAILGTALAVADAEPGDLERYLASLQVELDLRTAAAVAAGDQPIADLWKSWCTGARHWLRELCLGLAAGEGR